MQYTCEISDGDIAEKRKTALLAASINIFIVLTVLAVRSYSKQDVMLETKLWELQTVTVGSYSLEFLINEE